MVLTASEMLPLGTSTPDFEVVKYDLSLDKKIANP
jgi:hypothetical protein